MEVPYLKVCRKKSRCCFKKSPGHGVRTALSLCISAVVTPRAPTRLRDRDPASGEVLSSRGEPCDASKELCREMKDFLTLGTEAGVCACWERAEEVCQSVSAAIADKEQGLFSRESGSVKGCLAEDRAVKCST